LAGIIYAIGGRLIALPEVMGSVEAYDPDANQWTVLAPMPTPRAGPNGAALNGIIYTYGGEEPGSTNNQHEAFDPASGTWELLPLMPQAKHGSAVGRPETPRLGTATCLAGGNPILRIDPPTSLKILIAASLRHRLFGFVANVNPSRRVHHDCQNMCRM
jgi:hypothetical protein